MTDMTSHAQEPRPLGSLHSGSRKEVEMGGFQEPILKRRKAGKISKIFFLCLAPHNEHNYLAKKNNFENSTSVSL